MPAYDDANYEPFVAAYLWRETQVSPSQGFDYFRKRISMDITRDASCPPERWYFHTHRYPLGLPHPAPLILYHLLAHKPAPGEETLPQPVPVLLHHPLAH